MNYRMVIEYCACVQSYSTQQYSSNIQEIVNYINLNLSSSLSLKSLSELFHLTPSYLSKLFKQEIGMTLTDYINTLRINRAAIKLLKEKSSISSIATSVGILDVNYFTKLFKRQKGIPPSQFRNEHKGPPEKLREWIHSEQSPR